MIGSKRKIKTSYAYLKTKGITQEQLDRVHSPIGLAIGAETPEEIAVAIMAEIIQIRRQGTGIKPEV
jgi:xanthine dehydrogenase accessory factor